jgi:probable HAF family extracellular repeat protein
MNLKLNGSNSHRKMPSTDEDTAPAKLRSALRMRSGIGTVLRKFKVVGLTLVAGSAVLFVGNPATALAASILGLGEFPNGFYHSWASDLSADGSVVVGGAVGARSTTEAFRWARSGGMESLENLPSSVDQSVAYAVSHDGGVAVGTKRNITGGTSEAFRWTRTSGMVGLGDLPGGQIYSDARDVSGDGAIVVGISTTSHGDEAFRWTQDKGMVGLGSLPGGNHSSSVALGISAIGNVIVGDSRSVNGTEAFRWTEGGGMTGLGDLPGGDFYSTAFGVSADGAVIVGWSHSANGYEAFRWTTANGMEGLGDLAGGAFLSWASGASGDGSVVVGDSRTEAGLQAFMWTADSGLRLLSDVLVSEGADLSHWLSLDAARAVSGDGLWIVGFGRNLDGNTEAFLAQIPEPSANALLVLGVVAMLSCGCARRSSLPLRQPAPARPGESA